MRTNSLCARTENVYVVAVDANARLAALTGLLQRDGRVEVAEAAEAFGTAEMTVRRDLDRLVAMGMARRVRGGAISLLMRGDELPFAMRALEHAEAKARIGAAVADVLRDGEAVLLDSGTTSVAVGRALAGRRLTVMALSLHVATVLSAGAAGAAGAAGESVRLLVCGGEARPGELAMVGPIALAGIAALRFDTAVLAPCGLAGGQITAHDLGDAAVKRAMIAASARVVVAADGSKFGQTALAVVSAVGAVDMVITDATAPGDALDALRAAGVEVRCA
jgi:DeoR family transcriptional regulator, fructose operon transcriptional repressor